MSTCSKKKKTPAYAGRRQETSYVLRVADVLRLRRRPSRPLHVRLRVCVCVCVCVCWMHARTGAGAEEREN